MRIVYMSGPGVSRGRRQRRTPRARDEYSKNPGSWWQGARPADVRRLSGGMRPGSPGPSSSELSDQPGHRIPVLRGERSRNCRRARVRTRLGCWGGIPGTCLAARGRGAALIAEPVAEFQGATAPARHGIAGATGAGTDAGHAVAIGASSATEWLPACGVCPTST